MKNALRSEPKQSQVICTDNLPERGLYTARRKGFETTQAAISTFLVHYSITTECKEIELFRSRSGRFFKILNEITICKPKYVNFVTK